MDAIFFPRNDYPNNVEVCAHRLGKVMTYTEHTDTYRSESYSLMMGLAKQRNIKTSMFVYAGEPITNNILKQDLQNNHIWLDVYALAPNYSEKITHYEDISQEEWNTAYNDYLLPNFYNFTGKKPIALGYAYGNSTFKDYITQVLCGRDGGYYVDGPTDYGVGYGNPANKSYSFENYKQKFMSIRWYDYVTEQGHTLQEGLNKVSAQIDETKQNGGWMIEFTHWHEIVSEGHEDYAEPYFDLLASKNQNNDIYFSGYGEAVAYLVYRQMITRCVMYSPVKNLNNQLVIRLETDNSTLNVDTDLLQIPISIKFSTVGTPLEGMSIKCENRNLINLGSNQYIVEIPFGRFPVAVLVADDV